jgi:hypothetical protein
VTRRSVLVAAGWLGAAVLAVLVGLGAINVIGSGLTSSGGAPKTEAEVRRELAALPSPSASASLGVRPSTAPASRSFGTRGGTVVATCSAAGATIISMSPESGFGVHERTSGAQAEAEGEFRGISDNHDRVKFSVSCSGGVPTLSPRGGDD